MIINKSIFHNGVKTLCQSFFRVYNLRFDVMCMYLKKRERERERERDGT